MKAINAVFYPLLLNALACAGAHEHGANTAGASSSGAGSQPTEQGGSPSSNGGTASGVAGSAASGGVASGGVASGGAASGGVASGGAALGGRSNSQSPTGGAPTGAGGTLARGGAGSGGDVSRGGRPPFVPVTCAPDASPPPQGPKLEKGVWKQIDASPTYWANGVTIDPCNPSVLYTAGGTYPSATEHGVYRSMDGGATWTQLVSLDSPARVRVDPRNSKNMYVVDGVNGATNGFYRSFDGGAHWEMPKGFIDAASSPQVQLRDAYDVQPDPEDFRHVLVTFHNPWAGGNQASGVFETFDAGDHWTIHMPPAEWANGYGYNCFFLSNPALGIGDSRTWLLGSQGKGYWKTSNGGVTWKRVSNINMAHGGAQMYYTKQGVLYVSGEEAIIKSTDNGDTFTEIQLPISGHPHLLAVYGDGNRLYTGGYNTPIYTALESDDTKWTKLNDQVFKAGPYEMAYDAKNKILYSSNASGGLWALQQ